MSQNYKFAKIQSNRSTWSAGQVIEAVLTPKDEQLNTQEHPITLVGEAKLFSTGTTHITETDDINIDPLVGAAAFIKTIQVVDNTGSVIVNDVPRTTKIVNQALKYRDEIGLTSDKAAALLSPNHVVSKGLCQGSTSGWMPFALTLLLPHNMAAKPINGNKHGTMRIRITLNDDADVAHGSGVTTDFNYQLRNIEVRYHASPLSKDAEGTNTMLHFETDSQIIQTSRANVTSFVSYKCLGALAAFILQADLDDITKNSTALQTIPGLNPYTDTVDDGYGASRVSYSIKQDSTAIVTFPLERRSSILATAFQAFKMEPTERRVGDVSVLQRAERHALALRKMRDGKDGYLIGLNFGQPYDLSEDNVSFNMDIESEVADNYAVNVVFKCLISV